LRARRAAIAAGAPMSAMRCPGAPALLVGDPAERGPQGANERVFATTLAADESVLAAAQTQAAPAARIRFAPICVENDCAHWSGGGCAVLGRIAQLLAEAAAPVKRSPAYECSIRHDCRWRGQRGDEACGICGFVAREPARSVSAARGRPPPPGPLERALSRRVGSDQNGFQVDSGVNFR
jgi:hypothetical protein